MGVTWPLNWTPPGLSSRVLVFLFQTSQWEELFLSRPGLSHQDETHQGVFSTHRSDFLCPRPSAEL